MSSQVLAKPEPASKGRVLVIGVDERVMDSFKTRIIVRNHWEIMSEAQIPRDVLAVCFSGKVRVEHAERIRGLARRAGVTDFRTGHSAKELRDCLIAIIGVELPQAKSVPPPVVIPDANPVRVSEAELDVAQHIPTDLIRRQPDQPRSYFNSKKMAELRESIRQNGQIVPAILKKVSGDKKIQYELIEGERRWRVCSELGRPLYACIRTVTNAEEQFRVSFAANFAREGHTPLDTARAINRQMEFEAFSHLSKTERLKIIGASAGKSGQWASLYLLLLSLPLEVQQLLEPDEEDRTALPLLLGTFLCSIARPDIQLRVAQEAVAQKLSVKQAKTLARRLAIEAGLKAGSAERTPNKDYRIMRNFLRHTIEGANSLLEMPHRTLDQLFQHRGLEERLQAMREIDDAVKLLETLKSALDLRTKTKK